MAAIGVPALATGQRADPSAPNALSQGFSILGDEWSLFLLRFALHGVTRYSDFAAQVPISHAVLSGRLDLLTRAGVMERRQYQDRPPRAEYVLTDIGRATWPILSAMWGWERTWVREHSYATPPMRHTVCDHEITPVLVCGRCHETVRASDLDTEWGPAGGWHRSVPEATTRRRSITRGAAIAHTFYPDTMAVFGNRWSAALMGAALLGIRRFTDFEAALGAAPTLLSGRLASLCSHGILRQAGMEDHLEYRLTTKGLDFFPVVAMAIGWAERWFSTSEGPALVSIHRECGAEFQGRLVCSHCQELLAASDLKLGSAPA